MHLRRNATQQLFPRVILAILSLLFAAEAGSVAISGHFLRVEASLSAACEVRAVHYSLARSECVRA
jgi:hypothetical protein